MGTPRNNSVYRAFDILCCFDERYPTMSVAEVAERTGISQATVHRFLLTLEEVGAVARNKDGSYQLGMLINDLGGRILQTNVLANITQPYVNPLAEQYGETIHVAILTGDLVSYIGKGESMRSLKIDTYVGKQLPAYCSGVGKVLLAGLSNKALEGYLQRTRFKKLTDKTITSPEALYLEIDKTRQQGFGVDDEETEEGLRCIAVPIYDFSKQYIKASISISGPTTRLNWKNRQKYVKDLSHTARLISKKAYPKKNLSQED